MKKTLIATLLVSAFGLAAAQTGTPAAPVAATPATGTVANTPSPKVQADKTVEHADRTDLRTQRTNTRSERQSLKAARASGNAAAVKTDEQALKADKSAQATDKANLKGAHATTHLQRGAHKKTPAQVG